MQRWREVEFLFGTLGERNDGWSTKTSTPSSCRSIGPQSVGQSAWRCWQSTPTRHAGLQPTPSPPPATIASMATKLKATPSRTSIYIVTSSLTALHKVVSPQPTTLMATPLEATPSAAYVQTKATPESPPITGNILVPSSKDLCTAKTPRYFELLLFSFITAFDYKLYAF
ncbi:hypothetical protein O3P69_017083 [Scylla paramamosain]|uniref:Uncharacterized protein n=1 Tax=Scylla paramamosain TaxID=85552 RepID=A0AAW0TVK3_SCYPA